MAKIKRHQQKKSLLKKEPANTKRLFPAQNFGSDQLNTNPMSEPPYSVHPDSKDGLLVLHFRDKLAQSQALFRIQAFYESWTAYGLIDKTDSGYGTSAKIKKYIPAANFQAALQKNGKLKHEFNSYMGYNFPFATFLEWDAARQAPMGISSSSPQSTAKADGLADVCPHECPIACTLSSAPAPPVAPSDFVHPYERTLVTHLQSLHQTSTHTPIRYLVSFAGRDLATLAHEKLHAQYFMSEGYRLLARKLYDGLRPETRRAVDYNLGARGYDEAVWTDEFQAYVAGSLIGAVDALRHEFGKRAWGELVEVREELVGYRV